MPPVRLLPREFVEEELRKLGCEPLDEPRLKTAQFWKTPWGHHFLVPEFGPDRRCDEYTLQRVLADITASRPLSH